jgi:hypothetical protein
MCASTSHDARADGTGSPRADGHGPGRLSCRRGLSRRGVHDHRHLVKVNLGWGAIPLRDHLLARRGVHLLGGFAVLPQADAACDLVLAKEVVLADQPRRALRVGCRFLVDRFRVFERHAHWKLKADDGGKLGSPRNLRSQTWAHRRPAWAGLSQRAPDAANGGCSPLCCKARNHSKGLRRLDPLICTRVAGARSPSLLLA